MKDSLTAEYIKSLASASSEAEAEVKLMGLALAFGCDVVDRLIPKKPRKMKQKQSVFSESSIRARAVAQLVGKQGALPARKEVLLLPASPAGAQGSSSKRRHVAVGSRTAKYVRALYEAEEGARLRGDELDYYSYLPQIRRGQKSRRELTDVEVVANAKAAVRAYRRRLEREKKVREHDANANT